MGYRKVQKIKLVRVTHEVTFNVGYGVTSIVNYLKNVPPKAELVSLYVDNEDGNAGKCTMIFQI